jgi:hypothetical protein
VTARLLTEVAHPPPVAELKREVVGRCAGEPLPIGRLVELAGERYPQSRVSERVALCEQTVWELLHEGAVELVRSGAPIGREQWEAALLSWEAWSDDGVTVARA